MFTEEEEQALKRLLVGPLSTIDLKAIMSFTQAVEVSKQNAKDIEYLKRWTDEFEEKSSERHHRMLNELNRFSGELHLINKSITAVKSIGKDSEGYAKLAGSFVAGLVLTVFAAIYAVQAGIEWLKQTIGVVSSLK